MTHTHTTVKAPGPCGHYLPIPNNAYGSPVELEPCESLDPDREPTVKEMQRDTPRLEQRCARVFQVVVHDSPDEFSVPTPYWAEVEN